MTSFDADLVRGWFDRLADPTQPVMPHWGIMPTDQEARVLAHGRTQVAAAVVSAAPPRPTTNHPPTEVPALMLQRYLGALAAGVVSTRLAFASAFDDPTQGADHGDLPVADAGTMALVAGLNAGAAALLGDVTAAASRPGRDWRAAEPTAAESARQAGVAAAELVVDGAVLHEVAAAAAGVAMNGWRIGLPDDPADRIEYRARGLIGLLLVALELQTRDPEPPAEPAGCGALPGENLGRQFAAEITFSMGLPPTEIRSLSTDLAGLATEVTVWPGTQWPQFHVHTDRPGDVIGQVYAYGTPFDLLITDCG